MGVFGVSYSRHSVTDYSVNGPFGFRTWLVIECLVYLDVFRLKIVIRVKAVIIELRLDGYQRFESPRGRTIGTPIRRSLIHGHTTITSPSLSEAD